MYVVVLPNTVPDVQRCTRYRSVHSGTLAGMLPMHQNHPITASHILHRHESIMNRYIPGTPVRTFLLQCQPYSSPALALCLSMAQTTTCLF